MKRTIYTLLFSLSFFALFTTCKNPKIDYDTFSITSESIQPDKRKVLVSGEYDFLGEVMSMKLNMGRNEQMTDAESYPVNLDNQSFSITVEGLEPYTHYKYCYAVEFDNNHKLLTDVGTFMTLSDKPEVRTLETKAVDSITYSVKSIVDDDFGMGIIERGVCWALANNPSINDNHVAHQVNGLGEYTCIISGLELNTTYFVRAYAKNGIGLSYAEEVLCFETEAFEKPTVETLPMETSAYTQTSAYCCGKIKFEGSSPVTQRGICWSTTPNPDVDGNYVSSDTNENDFCALISNLLPSTTYYFCAYAINTAGTGYGKIRKFTTLDSNKFKIEVISH